MIRPLMVCLQLAMLLLTFIFFRAWVHALEHADPSAVERRRWVLASGVVACVVEVVLLVWVGR